MAQAVNIVQRLARVMLGVTALSAIAACNTDGVTANCRTEEGEQLPLYDIDDVDDSGLHPDAEVERIRAELVQRNCLTALGHATSPEVDSGSD